MDAHGRASGNRLCAVLQCAVLAIAAHTALAAPAFDGVVRETADGSAEAYMIPPYLSNHASTIEVSGGCKHLHLQPYACTHPRTHTHAHAHPSRFACCVQTMLPASHGSGNSGIAL